MATDDLFHKIITLTDAKCDNDHLHVLIDNNTDIPDRTGYILHNGRNPLKYLVESAARLECMGADVLIMPCNTAHYFYDQIVEFTRIPFLNMIDETAKEIRKTCPPGEKIGLLATDGTCKAGIYDRVFRKYQLDLVKPSAEDQTCVMKLIYGIKAGGRDFDVAAIQQVMQHLKDQGASTFVLGCTELPVAFQMLAIGGNYIDPTCVLACSAIRFAGGKCIKQ